MSCSLSGAKSAIDPYLHCADEAGSLWSGDYGCTRPFSLVFSSFDSASNLKLGGKTTSFDCGKVGDVLYKVWAQVDLPAAGGYSVDANYSVGVDAAANGMTADEYAAFSSVYSSGQGAAHDAAAAEACLPYYQNGAPFAFLQKVVFKVNGSAVDTLYGENMYVDYQQSDKSARGLDSSVGIASGADLRAMTAAGMRAIVELPFFFSHSSFNAYKLAAHGNVKLTVELTCRDVQDLLRFPYGSSTNAIVNGGSAAANAGAAVRLFTAQAVVSDEERESIWNSANDSLIVQNSQAFDGEAVPASGAASKKKFTLAGQGPVRDIHFWFNVSQPDTMAAPYFNTLSGHGFAGDQSFDSMDFMVNSQKVHDTLSAEMLKAGMAAIGGHNPSGRYYNLRMCLAPRDMYQPTGSVALFRHESVAMTFEWLAAHAACTFNCVVQYYNVMRLRKGSLGFKLSCSS